ncbi:hypothetical protein HF086_011863 [Spodoptera exigua]|uniref:Transposase Helix-turn-helix domain-containing protein n=1 Tax=Spodoptera exigua TaxID=7107 RepID=A0A922SDN9_SPOEX|nr:hypothetical protein HF086_011863 [Spodoptera exigua]
MNLNIVRYFDASDSEDSSDDDNTITHFILMRRRKTFRVRNSPLETWDDVDFCQRYRLSKETLMWIVCEIGDYLKTPTTRNHDVTPLEQVLLTLRFYVTGILQQCSGDLSGMSKSTACKIIHAVSRTICIK